jgi:cytochrome c oxidase cbb3-type subunit 3
VRHLILTVFAGWTAVHVMAADRPDPAAVERGRKEFVSSCGFCHGNDATGNRAPDLIRSPLVNHDEHGELLGPLILTGRPDKGMPGVPLNPQQISDVSTFLHNRVEEAMRSNGVSRDYPVEKLLTGNVREGQAYFNGAGKCSGCHSPTGDLAGIARKYSPIDLQSRFLYPRAPRSTVTVTLPSGKTISGTLVHLDEFDVALRDSSGEYYSWLCSVVKVEVHDPLEAHRELMKKYSDTDVHNIFAYLETLK